MNVLLLGAAGFIGTNIAKYLANEEKYNITLVDRDISYFNDIIKLNLSNTTITEFEFCDDSNFDELLRNKDMVIHLVSTTVPTTSNQQISEELKANVVVTAKLLDACVRQGVKRIVFISSGGTVYGKEANCPLKEDTPTNPISSYGIQKVSIEKLLYLYHYLHGLDYRVIRLANPYGPFQRPNGVLGAVTTFTYKALKKEDIVVYGDGSVIRDFIYIDDAVRGIMNISINDCKHKIYNLGCGKGVSIKEILNEIESILGVDLNIIYKDARKVDVPVNYLDISRYEEEFGRLNPVSLAVGITKTAEFMRKHYNI